VRPLRGRPLWGRPCSWVRTDGGNGRCHGNEGTRARRHGILTPPAKYQVDRTTGSEVI